MSNQADFATIQQLLPVKKHRCERAEAEVDKSKRATQQAQQELEDAIQALDDYKNKISRLIQELYQPVMNTEITKEYLEELTRKEGLLHAKIKDFEASVEEAEKNLALKENELAKAKQVYREESMRLDKLKDLEKSEAKKSNVEKQRQLGREIDELASTQYIRRSSSSMRPKQP